ncbi:hypothetical protein ACFPOC_11620 [Rubellimicrobium aerolatum]|uniref:Uncharacterized protein n=1 Tax=Rubellimicrobium aerolatum TaxID=490979 RepID=A0ABW0SDP8_9RHOB
MASSTCVPSSSQAMTRSIAANASGAAVPGGEEHVAEAGEQPDLVVHGAPVALQRGRLAPLDAPEHLAEQPLEHQHRVVGGTYEGRTADAMRRSSARS